MSRVFVTQPYMVYCHDHSQPTLALSPHRDHHHHPHARTHAHTLAGSSVTPSWRARSPCAVKTTVLLPHKRPHRRRTHAAVFEVTRCCVTPTSPLPQPRDGCYDAQTGIPTGCPVGAKCVQRLDDSQMVQIALRFAFHCVLHRCRSLEIHC